jgi:ABC-type Fe3+-hydroxamate transport system substrate-binding protein
MMRDDLGHADRWRRPAERVVSLVPSITETLADERPEALVGVTDYCTHPVGLSAARVRGTKNPDLGAIRALGPDLVVANKEENRKLDVHRLREAGVPVWVTDIETVPQALDSLARLFADGLDWPAPGWIAEARRLWCGPLSPVSRRVVVPIWRDPWMVVGADTFTGDLVRRAGWLNVGAEPALNPDGERYPRVDAAALDAAGADVVLLPDEPYAFSASDGPEAFRTTPTELVSGRLLTWYGPSLLDARRSLARG